MQRLYILKFFDLVEIYFDWCFMFEYVNYDFCFIFVVVYFVYFIGKVSEWFFFDYNCFVDFKISFCMFFYYVYVFKNMICFFWK